MPRISRSRFIAGAGGAALALSMVVAPMTASAADPNNPAPNNMGPHPNLPRISNLEAPACQNLANPQIDEFRTYDELSADLVELEENARFDVELFSIGESNQGRDIWAGRIGTGDKVFIIQGQIHGNEMVGAEAIFRQLDWLANSNAREARTIRNELTIIAIPRLNVDGGELDQRQNARNWEEVVADFPQLEGVAPAWNYSTRTAGGHNGFDMNRDFHPNLEYVPQPEDFPGDSTGYGWYINPESQHVRDLYIDLQEEFGNVDAFVDVHHQGPCVARDDTRELIDVAVDYPPLPDWHFEEGGKYSEWENMQDESRSLAMSAYAGIVGDGYLANRYGHAPERDIPGQARSAFALNGTATVLFEIRGQTQSLGQLGRERFTRATVAGLHQMAMDLAQDSVDQYNPDEYDDLPGNVTLRPQTSALAID